MAQHKHIPNKKCIQKCITNYIYYVLSAFSFKLDSSISNAFVIPASVSCFMTNILLPAHHAAAASLFVMEVCWFKNEIVCFHLVLILSD